jgi:hypothetical protein
VVHHHKPRVQTPVVNRYPALTPVHDFVLLFLPPCGPHSTLLATGSLKPSLLVSPLLGGRARHRPFTLALHLHQRKSSRNLQLQYSAKSQFIPRCQSLITVRSNHPPILRRSGPQREATSKSQCGGAGESLRLPSPTSKIRQTASATKPPPSPDDLQRA